MDFEPLSQGSGPFVQRRQGRVQDLAGLQAREGRGVDPHTLGDCGQRQALAFADRLEARQQVENRGETLLIDAAGRSFTNRPGRVLATDRLFSGPLLGRALRLNDRLPDFTPLARALRRQRSGG